MVADPSGTRLLFSPEPLCRVSAEITRCSRQKRFDSLGQKVLSRWEGTVSSVLCPWAAGGELLPDPGRLKGKGARRMAARVGSWSPWPSGS